MFIIRPLKKNAIAFGQLINEEIKTPDIMEYFKKVVANRNYKHPNDLILVAKAKKEVEIIYIPPKEETVINNTDDKIEEPTKRGRKKLSE